MARACAIIPRVVNKSGKKTESRLYKSLLSFLPNKRQLVNKIYHITKSGEFIKNWNPRLTLDDNNEPTLKSLLDKTNIRKVIDDDSIIKRLNIEVGHNKPIPDNTENYNKVIEKAINFNTSSDFRDEYVALVERNEKEGFGTLTVTVSRKNKASSREAANMEYNYNLNKRLREILTSKGISIGALTELERKLGVNGVTDFNLARTSTEGIIELIRLAEGERGEKALPEEFAHFAVDALGGNPLVTRLLNLIVSKNLAKEIIGEDYEEYSSLYKGDEIRLAKEAMGKLLAKHLLQEVEIPQKSYKTLLGRVISSIKNFFRGLSVNSLKRAMVQADSQMSGLARNILNGNLDSDMSVQNISETSKFYNTSQRVARSKALLQSIIENELKRLEVYKKRSNSQSFSVKQQLLINKLEQSLAANNEIEGVFTFMERALEIMSSLDSKLTSTMSSSDSLNQKAQVLRDVRNYLYSYKHMVEDIRGSIIEEEKYNDNRYGDTARDTLKSLSDLLEDLFVKYNKSAIPLFIDFLKPYLGNGLKVPYGKNKDKVISIDTLIEETPSGFKIIADKDISFFDRWLDSMADSSDYFIKIMDQAIKASKEDARLNTIDRMKKIMALGVELEQSGVKDTKWMFEKDSKGNSTGRYIQEINYALYYEKKAEMYKRLKDKYGDNPTGEDAKAFAKERSEWYNDNTEIINGVQKPKLSIYRNKEFENLSKAKRDFYNSIIDIKRELDSKLPENYTSLYNTIKIRKDLIERVKSSESLAAGGKQIWENIKDQFIRRSDDTEYAERATIKDFEGREVQVLPIYYTKLRKGESNNDISTDVVSTMVAYAAMAEDFSAMNKVIDVLELSRDMLRDNLEIRKERGGKPLKEKFNALGRTVESKVTKSRDRRRIIERLDDAFEMQVYNRYMADEGTFGDSKVDKAKVIDYITRLTALNSLALNVISGISNVATGKVMMRIESFAGEFFSEKDTITADRIYSANIMPFMAELGNRVKTSKLALFSELFNIPQEFEQDIREVNFDRKTWFSRMFNTSATFFMNNAGEHWMQHRTALALANRYKMKSPDGKTVSLWDALEVKYIDEKNHKKGAILQVKEGYTKEDGTEFTREDIRKFSRRCAAINQKMHGIYNRLDRSAVQRLAIGRMGFLFRKWIPSALNRRFKSLGYNFDIDEWTEGYYITSGRFLKQLAKELRHGQLSIVANWKNLDKREKANIRRALTEIGHFLAVALILGFVAWPDDDKNRPWLVKQVELQLRRLYTELGSQTPTPLMVKEGLRIVKSPAAGVNTIEDILNLVGILNPYNYEELLGGEDAVLQSDRYKDHNKATRLFFESPILVGNKTIYRDLFPEESIPFYKQ